MSSSKIVLITGANTGLGFEIVRALSSSSNQFTILVGGRSIDKANKAVEKIQSEYPDSPSSPTAVQIDIEDDESIDALYQQVTSKFGRLDILVNNAGAQFQGQADKLTMRQIWSKSWDLNVASTQVMTHKFVPLLLKSEDPRIIFMASGTSSLGVAEIPHLPFNKSPGKGWPKTYASPQQYIPSYRASKTGLNMPMREWHRILLEDNVKVWAVSPGFLATGLVGDPEIAKAMGAMDPSIGGEFVKDVIEGARDEDVGKVIQQDRVQPW